MILKVEKDLRLGPLKVILWIGGDINFETSRLVDIDKVKSVLVNNTDLVTSDPISQTIALDLIGKLKEHFEQRGESWIKIIVRVYMKDGIDYVESEVNRI